MRRVLVLALLVVLIAVDGVSGQTQRVALDVQVGPFPYPAAIRPQVEFWKKIFATYSKYQVVIHDTEYIDKVYKVLDFRALLNEEGMDETAVLRIREKQTKRELENIRAILLKLHRCGSGCDNLDAEEQRIWNLYRDIDHPNKFRHATYEDRLRSQPGLRERFGRGIEISRRYLREMENIFRSEGLPVELTRLPLIESCFDLRAYSKAAAAGIWQFIPATGRLYMRIDGTMDERRDPLIATRAAARLLKSNYEMLGAWPLAITAYNHGPYGMVKAAKTLGTTDIAYIIRHYKGKRFGFASKNFYPEFLAAVEVEKNHRTYFGPLRMEPPLRYEEVEVQDFIALKHIIHCADTTE
ncbi:MAG: lytic transglycosylase domain-containing protein, partial [Candidatus Binatia bacterium]